MRIPKEALTAFTDFFLELYQEILSVSVTLFKIMIPVILIVKALDMLGLTIYLAMLLAPLMQLLGLPESMGIVWATTIMTNMYAGMVVFVGIPLSEPLTIAQVSVLSGLMLIAHGLPVEGAIAKKAGVNIYITLLVRLGGGFLFAWILHTIYSSGGWMQQSSELLWQAAIVTDHSLAAWLLEQAKSLVAIQLIIIVLLFFLKLLKLVGIERVILWLLKPLLRVLGIGEKAATLTVIGITLGLSFGGGLLISEANKGHIAARDIFTAMVMLSLLHSIIEDTLLVLMLGADFNAVFWGRIVFTFVVVAVLTRVAVRFDDSVFQIKVR